MQLLLLLSLLLISIFLRSYLLYALFTLVLPVRFTKWFIFNVSGASWQEGDLTTNMVQPGHVSAPQLSGLPASGELLEYDFRSNIEGGRQVMSDDPKSGQRIRAVSYNVFLAQNLEGVIEELKTMDPAPDVIFLQEDNIYQLPGDPRPKFHHAGAAIARAMGMTCVFVNAHYRGDPESNGLYGMAILSRFKLRNVEALKCETQPWIVDEMTTWLKGERHFPYAEIGMEENAVALTSIHLPCIGKFREKMEMIEGLFQQLKTRTSGSEERPSIPSIVGGDMNTAPLYYRWILPFGSNDLYFSLTSETHFYRNFIKSNDCFDPFSNDDGTFLFPGGFDAKLDWILFQNDRFNVISFEVEPQSTPSAPSASDHRWISVMFTLANGHEGPYPSNNE